MIGNYNKALHISDTIVVTFSGLNMTFLWYNYLDSCDWLGLGYSQVGLICLPSKLMVYKSCPKVGEKDAFHSPRSP